MEASTLKKQGSEEHILGDYPVMYEGELYFVEDPDRFEAYARIAPKCEQCGRTILPDEEVCHVVTGDENGGIIVYRDRFLHIGCVCQSWRSAIGYIGQNGTLTRYDGYVVTDEDRRISALQDLSI